MNDAVPVSIPIISTAVGQCTGCGSLLFANVFHVCAANMHLHEGAIAQEVLKQLLVTSYVAAPPAPTTTGLATEPPALKQTVSRTHCEVCEQRLDPTVMHLCAGNK